MRIAPSSLAYDRSFQLAQRHPSALRLHLAVPYYSPPAQVYEAANKAIRDGLCNNYGPLQGIFELREMVVRKLQAYNEYDVTTDNILMTVGAQEAFALAMIYLLNPGDIVIVFSPTYPGHISTIEMMGGRILYSDIYEERSSKIEVSELEDLWHRSNVLFGSYPKVLVICDPVNPTGSCLSKYDQRVIAEFALTKGLWVVTDETYEFFHYDDNHYSLGAIREVRPWLISCFSLSKTFSLSGWRIGYVVSDISVINNLSPIHDNLTINVSNVAQYAALAALTEPNNWISEKRVLMQNNRDTFIAGLNRTKTFSAILPQGGLSVFAKILKPIDSDDLINELAKTAGVIGMSGKAFSPEDSRYIRFSFGQSDAILVKSIELILDWEKNLQLL